MRKLPTGTVTLLFTDIEGSTRLLQHLGERYALVLKEHRRLLRTAFEQWNGYEVDTQGDAFFVVFERAADAVSAAIAVQQALFNAQWSDEVAVRVRIGLHTGEPQPAEEGYIGLDVHRAARIMCAAHGGQVLLSQETLDLVAHDLTDGVSVRDLGAYHLKDIGGLSQLFQLVIPGLPANFPPLSAENSHRPLRNVPSPSTSFVGREQETAAITALLRRADVRLLTLIGAAGVGKTRLALQAAAQLTAHDLFMDGVSFVALDQVSDAGGVVTALTQALNIQEESGSSLFEQVKTALCERSLLLILDNFEQVVAARLIITDLLAACPKLKLLVTSRAMLHVQAEHIFEVSPLALPNPAALPDLETLSHYAAIALFVQRAQAVQPDFRLTIANAPTIAKICIRLDGIPLAIELAAARIRRFPPQSLLKQMEQGLAVLAGGAHDMPTRQQTLHGAIAWSYNLLSSEEQRVFRRIAVFVNGATGEAAGSVCTAAGALEGSVLEALETLVDKSMLQRQDDAGSAGGIRFWLLQTLREYGLECLADAGEMEATRAAHAAYYLSWVEQAVPLLSGAEQADWLDRLGREYENVRAALEWLLAGTHATHATHGTQVETVRAEQTLRLCIALAGFWEIRGYFSEGLAFLERALAASDGVSPAIRAQALYDAGFLALMLDDNERAGGFLRESQVLFRASGDKASMANILRMQGNLARVKNSYKLARRLLEEALALYREQGDRRKMASTREDLAQIALVQSDFSKARKLLEENLTRYKALGEQYYTAHSLYLLACAHFLSRDDRARAQKLAEESLALFKEVGNRRLIAHVLSLLGQIALVANEDDRARSLLEESQATFKTVEDRFGAAETHIALARLTASQGNEEAARVLYQTSWKLLGTSGAKELNAACLEGFGEVLLATDAAEQAVRLWALAASVRAAIVAPMPPVYRASYVQAVATARQHLGEEAFQSAWAQGRELPLEQVQF